MSFFVDFLFKTQFEKTLAKPEILCTIVWYCHGLLMGCKSCLKFFFAKFFWFLRYGVFYVFCSLFSKFFVQNF